MSVAKVMKVKELFRILFIAYESLKPVIVNGDESFIESIAISEPSFFKRRVNLNFTICSGKRFELNNKSDWIIYTRDGKIILDIINE